MDCNVNGTPGLCSSQSAQLYTAASGLKEQSIIEALREAPYHHCLAVWVWLCPPETYCGSCLRSSSEQTHSGSHATRQLPQRVNPYLLLDALMNTGRMTMTFLG